jgi:hypothetical protein
MENVPLQLNHNETEILKQFLEDMVLDLKNIGAKKLLTKYFGNYQIEEKEFQEYEDIFKKSGCIKCGEPISIIYPIKIYECNKTGIRIKNKSGRWELYSRCLKCDKITNLEDAIENLKKKEE